MLRADFTQERMQTYKVSAVVLAALLVCAAVEAQPGPSSNFQLRLRVVQACAAHLPGLAPASSSAPGRSPDSAPAAKVAVQPRVQCTGGKPLYLASEVERPELSTVEVDVRTVLITF